MFRLRNILGSLFVATIFYAYLANSSPQGQTPFLAGPPKQHRIIAVGDLHGDFHNAIKVFQMAGVIDDSHKWTGNVDVLVQTGDIVDRGNDTIKLYSLMESLRREARAVGGDVVSHFGNHEWMNLLGDWRYVLQGDIDTFGGVEERQQDMATGKIGQAWREHYHVTSRVPLHPLVGKVNDDHDHRRAKSALSTAYLSFVHGGISPEYQDATPYPSRINSIGKSLLHRLQDQKRLPVPHPPGPNPGFPRGTPEEEEELYGNKGPLWYRGWAEGKDEHICAALEPMLKNLGVRRLIMGHTPDFDRIVNRCNGKIIIIDTGISTHYGGVLSALSITYSLVPGSGSGKWVEKEEIKALYPDQNEILSVTETVLDVDESEFNI